MYQKIYFNILVHMSLYKGTADLLDSLVPSIIIVIQYFGLSSG
ncbi:hypothetical protein H477_0924 [[Clostridium] sordellii ATCC 9714]|nr:hypothetical protein H477_0924 [[Clostridium] sordellii ATCC 9714] [Paeniclostridium sordellii ATCC 9714]